MKVIERYILKEMFGYFLVSLAAFTSVLLSVKILRFANLIINKGVDFSQIATVFVAIIPTFMEFAVPMAALLGSTLAIARLSGDSEIVVLRASGVSILQLVRPVIYYGVLITILALGISFYLRPWGYQKLDQTLFEIAQSKTISGLEAGVFNQLGQLVLYADQVDYETGALTHILIDDRRDPKERKIIVARSGAITSNQDDYEILIKLINGSIHENLAGKYSLTNFNTNSLRIDASELMGRGKRSNKQKLDHMSTNELWYEIQNRRNTPPAETSVAALPLPSVAPDQALQTGTESAVLPPDLPDPAVAPEPERRVQPLGKLRFELARRFSLPVASFLLAILGLPLGIQPPRLQKTWGATFSLSLGLGIFALYFGLLSFASIFGENEKFNPVLAAWIPNLFVLALTVYLLQRVGSETWQSVAHGLEKLPRIFGKLKFIRLARST